jgi:AcrR family transcriptional regulator
MLKDKKQLIINAAIKCFAQKGFHATSIQEIVDTAGIAKGSVYSYFKSKEDLLFVAIKHEYDRMMSAVLTVANDTKLTPRERLATQFQHMLQITLEYSDFIATLKNETDLMINDQMKAFMSDMHKADFQWYSQSILAIYGDAAKPYVFDAAIIIQAIVNRFTYINRIQLESSELTNFFMARLDDLVDGMIRKLQKPILTQELSENSANPCSPEISFSYEDSLKALQSIRTYIKQSKLETKIKTASLSYLTVLDHEITKDQIDPIITTAMISHLKSLDLSVILINLTNLELYVLNQ